MIKIYCHRNKQNGKVYIGQTCKTLDERACRGNGYRDSPRFYNAIKKYGWDMFESSVLSEVET